MLRTVREVRAVIVVRVVRELMAVISGRSINFREVTVVRAISKVRGI